MVIDVAIEFRDGGAGVVIDASYLPVIIRTYSGVTTEKIVRECTKWLNDRLSKLPRQQKVVVISDARAVTATDPKVRKVVAEESKKLELQMRAHNVDTIVILNSAVLRGAIKAVGWITTLKLMPAKDLEEAFRIAGESLASVGQMLPPGLKWATYRAPTAPMRETG